MRHCVLVRFRVISMVIVLVPTAGAVGAKDSEAPRTPWGAPDLMVCGISVA